MLYKFYNLLSPAIFVAPVIKFKPLIKNKILFNKKKNYKKYDFTIGL